MPATSGITATKMGIVVSHKQVIPSGRSGSGGGDNHQQHSLKSTLLISDAGTPYIKDLSGLSGSGPGPDVVDAGIVIALGVMGEDGQWTTGAVL